MLLFFFSLQDLVFLWMSREAWWRNLKLVIFFNFQGTVNFVLFLLCSHKLTLSLKLGLLHTLGCILCQVCNFGSSMLNFYYCLAFNILLSWNPKVVLLLSFSPCLFLFLPMIYFWTELLNLRSCPFLSPIWRDWVSASYI